MIVIIKRIDFGKIDYYRLGHKTNRVIVKMELTEKRGLPVFTASAEIWGANFGQCLDSALPYLKDNPLYVEIHRLWESYHNNDMHPGTEEQEKVIKEALDSGVMPRYDYESARNLLEWRGMLSVIHNGEMYEYEYGTGWIYKPIPKDDIELIKIIMDEPNYIREGDKIIC